MSVIIDGALAALASITVLLIAYMALLFYFAYVDPDAAFLLLRLAGL